jgi:ABC-2 type transport system ATP-binding protein
MRADICAALLHNPDILFLDEPTIGLDVVAKTRIRNFILHINHERKTTIILTTHDLSDVEKLCKRIMIIDHGKLLYDGDIETLNYRFADKREMVVDFVPAYDNPAIPGATIVKANGNRVTYQFLRDSLTASELIGRISSRYRIRDLEVRNPEIESTIRRIYENQLLENGY